MKHINPKFDKGDRIVNQMNDEEYRIQDMEYDKQLCDIVYTVQHYRYKFDMFTIPQTVIESNADVGDYKVIQQ